MKIPCLALAFFFSATFAASSADKPNILFIMVDDLGYGDLSCYGATDLRSPNIDGLFEKGMRFDNFYANCPVCSPTRAAFLTGMYPDKAGVPGVVRTEIAGKHHNWGKLREDAVLLPTQLKKAGYHTGIVGKWHLGLDEPDRPTDRGFDHFHGFLGDMMDDYYKHRRHGNHYMRLGTEKVDPVGHATDIFSDWAIDYMTEQAPKDDPFFLYLAYNAPHTPIQPPNDWYAKVLAREKDNGITKARAKLVALIEHLDAGIGRVLEGLEKTGEPDNTLIIFTSDNGGQVSVGARNAPLHGGKQDMWEGGIRVGTAAVWPGKIEAGSNAGNDLWLTMDFYPTLCEVAGVGLPEGDDVPEIDGRSLLWKLLGQKLDAPAPRDLYWVRLEGNQKYGGLPYHAVRSGQYKMLRNTPFEPYQLFDLKNDPGEENPIPRNRAPKVYDQLFNSLMGHIYQTGTVPWQRDSNAK